MAVTWRGWRFPKLHGGAPALDLVNTVDPRTGDEAEEFLVSPAALAAWAEYAGIARGARVTAAEFRRAITAREALYRVLVDVANRRRPSPDHLELVHAAHARVFGRAQPVRRGHAIVYEPHEGADAILWPVLESARALLADPSRLKECPGEGCGWVFLDTSRSGTRRWCSMGSCGARAKMRRYRAVRS